MHEKGALFWIYLRCRSELKDTHGYLLICCVECGYQPPCCLRVREFRHLPLCKHLLTIYVW